MLNITGKYCIVYKPCIRENGNVVVANICTTRKDRRYTPPMHFLSNWYGVSFVGHAYEKATKLKNQDKIDILKGSIVLENNKLRITIFDFVLSD